MLAIFMANAGGSWDNAKKFIEADALTKIYVKDYTSNKNLMGKNSEFHKATIVGDTVGDPFKDTAGPSLDILIKLMTMMGLLFVRQFKDEPFDPETSEKKNPRDGSQFLNVSQPIPVAGAETIT